MARVQSGKWAGGHLGAGGVGCGKHFARKGAWRRLGREVFEFEEAGRRRDEMGWLRGEARSGERRNAIDKMMKVNMLTSPPLPR